MPPRTPRTPEATPPTTPDEPAAPGHPLTPLPAEPTPSTAQAMPLWPAPFMRAQKVQHLMQQVFTRGMSNQCSTACMLPLHADAKTWHEWLSIQQAIAKRVQAQQQSLIDGLAGVAENYGELKLANTLSKFVEQEMNIVADINALVADQMAGWANLIENIQVDYGYWLSQKQHASH